MATLFAHRAGWLAPLLVAVTLLALAVACSPVADAPNTPIPAAAASQSQATAVPTPAAFPLTITDSLGRSVTVEAPPQRIASLSAGHTEILFAIGAGGQVTAVDNYSNYPPEAAQKTQLDAYQPNIEAIAAATPDFVFLIYDPGGIVEGIERLGIDVYLFEQPNSVEELLADILLFGLVTGRTSEAACLVTEMQGRIDAVKGRAPKDGPGPRVFHEIDSTLYTVGGNSFVGDLYTILGAQNIAADALQAFPQMTQELVIERDPEFIILADAAYGESPETVKARPGWSTISAVKFDRIYPADPDLFSRPGPRIVEALEILAGYLYPNLSMEY